MNEKMKILEMLASGVINATEAHELLNAIEDEPKESKKVDSVQINKIEKNENKKVMIYVDSAEGDEIRVNFPLKAIKAMGVNGFKNMAGANNNEAFNNIDLEAVFQAIDENTEGDIVNVSSAEGDEIRITIE